MSQEQDYFPPNGTKWVWGNKKLQTSPWYCNLSDQHELNLRLWPLRIQLFVDLKDQQYSWSVIGCDFEHTPFRIVGTASDALAACLEAEKVGEEEIRKLLPEWVCTALKNRWRPPA